MTKLQLLNRALTERLMAAVEEIMFMVGGTVSEYEEETIRARRENEILKRRLRWMEGEIPTEWPGQALAISPVPDEIGVEEQTACLTQPPGAFAIKTEPFEMTVSSPFDSHADLRMSLHNTDLESVIPSVSTGVDSISNTRYCELTSSYMAPLDHDPTLPGMVRRRKGKGRGQKFSFSCLMCSKVFCRESRLMLHMRTHSTEKPYMYRQRKDFFYGDKMRRKNQHLHAQPSRESMDDWSDCSDQTDTRSSSAVRSVPPQLPPALSTSTAPKHTDAEQGGAYGRKGGPGSTDSKQSANGTEEKLYQCPQCEKTFIRPYWLTCHMKTHKKKQLSKKKFQCLKCDKSFSRLHWLTMHMRSHRKNLLSRHQEKKQINSERTQKRNTGIETESSKGSTDKDIKGGTDERQQNLFQCPKCERSFSRKQRLKFHLKTHSRRRQRPRQQHEEQISKGRVAKKMLKSNGGEGEKKQFQCPQCEKSFSRTPWLTFHMMTHTRTRLHGSSLSKEEPAKPSNDEDTSFQCKLCDRKFSRSIALALHMRIHPKRRVGLRSMEQVTGHPHDHPEPPQPNTTEKEIKHEEIKKDFQCRHCGKMCSRPWSLANHMKIHSRRNVGAGHQDAEQVSGMGAQMSSPLPELSYPNPEGNLEKMAPKIFPCTQCGKICSQPCALANHMRMHMRQNNQNNEQVHDDEKPNRTTSDHAESSKPNKEEMPALLRKSLVCTHCGKICAHPASLARHMVVHVKQKSDDQWEEKQTRGAKSSTKHDHVEPLKKSMNDSLKRGDAEEEKVQEDETDGEDEESMEEKTPRKIFPCSICGKIFLREGWLIPHMRMHKKQEIPYLALYSKLRGRQTICTQSQVNEPITRASPRQSFQCPQCESFFYHKGKLKRHMLKHESVDTHEKDQPLDSRTTYNETCYEGINQTTEQQSDTMESLVEACEEEEECHDEEDGEEDLQEQETHRKTFPCLICGKIFLREGWLIPHMRTHHKQSENVVIKQRTRRKNICTQSSDESLVDSSVIIESQGKEKSVAGQSECIQCKRCDQVLTHKTWLKVHQRIHACQRLNSYRRNLTSIHDEMLRSNESVNTKMFEGDLCMSETSRSESKMERFKVQRETFPCPLCGKVFAWEMRLMMHMQIHLGEKPYLYRQRKEHYYGNATRRRNRGVPTKEPLKDEDVSDSASEEVEKSDYPIGMSAVHATEASVSPEPSSEPVDTIQNQSISTDSNPKLLPHFTVVESTDAATDLHKNNPNTVLESSSTVINFGNMQPRIVLQPIVHDVKFLTSPLGNNMESLDDKICELPQTLERELEDAPLFNAETEVINQCDVLEEQASPNRKQNESFTINTIFSLTSNFVSFETTNKEHVLDAESVPGTSKTINHPVISVDLDRPSGNKSNLADHSDQGLLSAVPETIAPNSAEIDDVDSKQNSCGDDDCADVVEKSTSLLPSTNAEEETSNQVEAITSSFKTSNMAPIDVVVISDDEQTDRDVEVDSSTSNLIEPHAMSSDVSSTLLPWGTDIKCVSYSSQSVSLLKPSDSETVDVSNIDPLCHLVNSRETDHSNNSHRLEEGDKVVQVQASQQSEFPQSNITSILNPPKERDVVPHVAHLTDEQEGTDFPSRALNDDKPSPDVTADQMPPQCFTMESGNVDGSCSSSQQTTDLKSVVTATSNSTSHHTEKNKASAFSKSSSTALHTDILITDKERNRSLPQQLSDTDVEFVQNDTDCQIIDDQPHSNQGGSSNFKNSSSVPKSPIRIENQSKTFACQVCNKAFDHPGKVRLHMQAHFRKKPSTNQQNKWTSDDGAKRRRIQTKPSIDTAGESSKTSKNLEKGASSSRIKLSHTAVSTSSNNTSSHRSKCAETIASVWGDPKHSMRICIFCNQPVRKIGQHLKSLHPMEAEVAEALSHQKNSKERRRILKRLCKKGNSEPSSEVVRNDKAVIGSYRNPNDTVPCIFCQCLFLRKNLWKHILSCGENTADTEQSQAQTNLSPPTCDPESLKTSLLDSIDSAKHKKAKLKSLDPTPDFVVGHVDSDSILIPVYGDTVASVMDSIPVSKRERRAFDHNKKHSTLEESKKRRAHIHKMSSTEKMEDLSASPENVDESHKSRTELRSAGTSSGITQVDHLFAGFSEKRGETAEDDRSKRVSQEKQEESKPVDQRFSDSPGWRGYTSENDRREKNVQKKRGESKSFTERMEDLSVCLEDAVEDDSSRTEVQSAGTSPHAADQSSESWTSKSSCPEISFPRTPPLTEVMSELEGHQPARSTGRRVKEAGDEGRQGLKPRESEAPGESREDLSASEVQSAGVSTDSVGQSSFAGSPEKSGEEFEEERQDGTLQKRLGEIKSLTESKEDLSACPEDAGEGEISRTEKVQRAGRSPHAADQSSEIASNKLWGKTEPTFTESPLERGQKAVDDRQERVLRKRRGESKYTVVDSDDESVSFSTKVHVCEHCNASFCSSYHLRRHVYTHTGERPFWCSQCNMGFTQKYRLRKHNIVHHGGKSYHRSQSDMEQHKKRTHDVEQLPKREAYQQALTKNTDEHPSQLTEKETSSSSKGGVHEEDGKLGEDERSAFGSHDNTFLSQEPGGSSESTWTTL